MATVRVTVKDNSNENSQVKLRVADAIADADITSLYTALGGIVLGTLGTARLATVVDKDAGSSAIPVSAFAQRETKWLATYTDDITGTAYRLEVPCADLGEIISGSQLMDLTAGDGLAWKTAFDAHILSKDGNAVTLQSMKHVGRNI